MTRKLSEDPKVSDFMAVAREYCEALEGADARSLRNFFEKMELLLPRLVSGALELPIVRNPGPPPPDIPHRKIWAPVVEKLVPILGERRRYWMTFDPTQISEDDPLIGDLADDLADVYCDLRRGLDAWRAATPATRLEIIWTWRFDYESHWGQHALEALRVVHAHLGISKLGRSTEAVSIEEARRDA